jgi:hypothetical protein
MRDQKQHEDVPLHVQALTDLSKGDCTWGRGVGRLGRQRKYSRRFAGRHSGVRESLCDKIRIARRVQRSRARIKRRHLCKCTRHTHARTPAK